MNALNLGVVGVGEMGRRHAEEPPPSVPHARLVAVADIDLERARTVAAELKSMPRIKRRSAWRIPAWTRSSSPRLRNTTLPAIAAAPRTPANTCFCEEAARASLDDADAALDATEGGRDSASSDTCAATIRPMLPRAAASKPARSGRSWCSNPLDATETSPAGACQVEANGTLFHDSTGTISISRAGSPAMRLSRSTLLAPPLPSGT